MQFATADNGLRKNRISGFRKKKQVRQQARNLHHQWTQGGSCKAQGVICSGTQPHLRGDRQKEMSIGKQRGV